MVTPRLKSQRAFAKDMIVTEEEGFLPNVAGGRKIRRSAVDVARRKPGRRGLTPLAGIAKPAP